MNVRRKLNNNGDTIVEVLIAMAVAASVLAIAYATTNRNLLITRSSQERAEATRIAQGQIESLRSVYDTAPATLPAAAGAPFCLDGTTVRSTGFAGTVPNAVLMSEDMTGYPTECQKDFYRIVITRDTAGKGAFHFYVRWDAIKNGTRDQIIMVYKVY